MSARWLLLVTALGLGGCLATPIQLPKVDKGSDRLPAFQDGAPGLTADLDTNHQGGQDASGPVLRDGGLSLDGVGEGGAGDAGAGDGFGDLIDQEAGPGADATSDGSGDAGTEEDS